MVVKMFGLRDLKWNSSSKRTESSHDTPTPKMVAVNVPFL